MDVFFILKFFFQRYQNLVKIQILARFAEITPNGLGYEHLCGLARTFASTRQAENSAGIFRISL